MVRRAKCSWNDECFRGSGLIRREVVWGVDPDWIDEQADRIRLPRPRNRRLQGRSAESTGQPNAPRSPQGISAN